MVGAIGVLNDNDRKMLSYLMIFDYTRGQDSTGLAWVNDKNETYLAKSVGHPFNLFNSWDSFDDRGVLKDRTARVLIGHNRAATRGKVTEANAHPFDVGNVVGAHNGTLTTTWQLDDAKNFDVDSEAIFYNINKDGIKEGMSRVNGAYALTFYNKVERKMYFLRNSQRPLFYTRRVDKDVIFWASERWMLAIAAGKANVSISEIIEFTQDKLFSFDMTLEKTFRTKDLIDEGDMLGYIPPPVVPYESSAYRGHHHESYVPFWDRNNIFQGQKRNGVKSSNVKREPVDKGLEIHIGETVEFYFVEETENNGVKYASCNALYEGFEIHIFNCPEYDEIMSLSTTWEAKVKKFVCHSINGKKMQYAIIDNRTLKDTNTLFSKSSRKETSKEILPWVDPNPPHFFSGFNNRILSEREYNQATSCGCAYCQQMAAPDEKIKWISHEEFLCGTCSQNPDLANIASISSLAIN